MKMKRVWIIGMVAALLLCLTACRGGIETLTTEPAETASVSESTAAVTTEADSTQPETALEESTTEESTSEESTTEETTTEYADNFPFLKQGYWYIYDEEKHCAYALSFRSGGKADIAYFNEYNVDGADAKFLTAACTYEINDNVLWVTELPSQINEDMIEIIIDGEQLLYYDKAMEQHDDLSLEHPFQHFNVVGMPYVEDYGEYVTGVTNG